MVSGVWAAPEKHYSNSPTVAQITNVNQLRDVTPTDWAYEALRNLSDRYGCVVAFPINLLWLVKLAIALKLILKLFITSLSMTIS